MSMSIFKTDPDAKELKKVEAERKKRIKEINKKEKEETKRLEKESKKRLKMNDVNLDSDQQKAEQTYKNVERETSATKDNLMALEKEDLEKIKANQSASEAVKSQRATVVHNDTQRKIDRENQKLSMANQELMNVHARLKKEQDENGSLFSQFEAVKNKAELQRQAADQAASVRTAELQNAINLKKENINDLQAINDQNKAQLKEVHDLLDFFHAHANNPTNIKHITPMAEACDHVHKAALKLVRSAVEEKDMKSLNDSLGKLKESLSVAKKVVEHPEVESNIKDLKAVAKTSSGKSNLWKKLGGALSMLVSAAVTFTLGLLGAPATGGTTAVIGAGVAGVFGATGLGLFFSGRQKGCSAAYSHLVKAAEQENKLIEIKEEEKPVPVSPASAPITVSSASTPTKSSQDNPMVDVAGVEGVAAPKPRF